MSQLQNQRTRKSYSIARRRSILTGSGSSSSKKVWLRLHNTAHGHQLAYCRPLSRTMLVACDITNWCHSAASLVKMTKFQPNPNSQTQHLPVRLFPTAFFTLPIFCVAKPAKPAKPAPKKVPYLSPQSMEVAYPSPPISFKTSFPLLLPPTHLDSLYYLPFPIPSMSTDNFYAQGPHRHFRTGLCVLQTLKGTGMTNL